MRIPSVKFSRWRRNALIGLLLLVVASSGFAVYVLKLDKQVTDQFEGKRWEVPSRVFARPLELYSGRVLSKAQLEFELRLLRYTQSSNPQQSGVGSYAQSRNRIVIYTRPFNFWDEESASVLLEVNFKRNKISSIKNLQTNQTLDVWRIEPLFIGGIYPKINEDRVLIRTQDAPSSLIKTLLAVEDHRFYDHYGVAPLSILRALIANIRAGSSVQGGSTLTQQLVKNFYLSSEKTLTRKLNEAIMALLLEFHYSKDEILEAYLNEIYLGQDGSRAIHGFGLAAEYYFDKPLFSLDESQIALLVGLVKGASFYNPRRFPDRALQRRNTVLTVQAKAGIIKAEDLVLLKDQALNVTEKGPSGVTKYPAFMDLVRRQLNKDYRPEDLSSAGLRIFTTIDPLVQSEVEQSVDSRLPKLERHASLPSDTLQAAAMVADSGSGAVRALIGGRGFRLSGFNRSLDSKRQIGSLIKPAVFLTALQRAQDYQLNTVLDDSDITIPMENGFLWTPENYDKKSHGSVSLISALANSYNLATVRLGMELGLENVAQTLEDLGLQRDIDIYPSLLLGAVDLSVYEVMQMYQTLSAEGFQTPLRSIQTVTTSNGKVLSRYAISVEQTLTSEAVYLMKTALQEVTKNGTAKKIYQRMPHMFNVAGKTGTTNDYRDSWFAGMTGDKVAVVWLGADDNQSIQLTGSSGALPIWIDIISATASRSLDVPISDNIVFARSPAIIHSSGSVKCESNRVFPFIKGSAPNHMDNSICTDVAMQ